jgi:RNA polymerase sigma factor (sigma-70 family)
MRENTAVVALVFAARDGDREAWNRMVERYAPLVYGICRTYRLAPADAEDVGQNVWMLLFEHLRRLRDPAALPGWLTTTTRNECRRVMREPARRRQQELTEALEPGVDGGFVDWEAEAERAQQRIALREAFEQLRPRCRELLELLFAEPAPSYHEISARLGMKTGSIGPTRLRCLSELRQTPALVRLAEERRYDSGDVRHAG